MFILIALRTIFREFTHDDAQEVWGGAAGAGYAHGHRPSAQAKGAGSRHQNHQTGSSDCRPQDEPDLTREILELNRPPAMIRQAIAFWFGVNQGQVNEVIKRGKWPTDDTAVPSHG